VIVILMGVSGVGKTTLGEALAEELGCEFLDADDFHPPENVARMAAGKPLTDEHRWPWLARLNAELRARRDAVLACSALKQAYRERLREGLAQSTLVFLRGDFELLDARASARTHRYMPASLLRSQFDTLEPPADAIEVDVAEPPAACIRRILLALQR
jgi:gluconokinase